MKRRQVHSVRAELLAKSREAALSAVQTFNNPLTQFKSEAFIVLMIIAWTYLLHAHYRHEGVEYRYYTRHGQRRRFDRTRRGSYKYWDLERCLNDERCPVDGHTRNNLKFLIGLRHEIEHQMTLQVGQLPEQPVSGMLSELQSLRERAVRQTSRARCPSDVQPPAC